MHCGQPWVNSGVAPKILVPHCSSSPSLETPEDHQGDSSCTESGKHRVGGAAGSQERISLSRRHHEDCRRSERL